MWLPYDIFRPLEYDDGDPPWPVERDDDGLADHVDPTAYPDLYPPFDDPDEETDDG